MYGIYFDNRNNWVYCRFANVSKSKVRADLAVPTLELVRRRVQSALVARLTQRRRHLCRPPLSQQRLLQLRDGWIALALQRPWADGTTHLVFTPTELDFACLLRIGEYERGH
jgi:hypothetical protein